MCVFKKMMFHAAVSCTGNKLRAEQREPEGREFAPTRTHCDSVAAGRSARAVRGGDAQALPLVPFGVRSILFELNIES